MVELGWRWVELGWALGGAGVGVGWSWGGRWCAGVTLGWSGFGRWVGVGVALGGVGLSAGVALVGVGDFWRFSLKGLARVRSGACGLAGGGVKGGFSWQGFRGSLLIERCFRLKICGLGR